MKQALTRKGCDSTDVLTSTSPSSLSSQAFLNILLDGVNHLIGPGALPFPTACVRSQYGDIHTNYDNMRCFGECSDFS